MEMWRLGVFIIFLCIGSAVWYSMVGADLFESWDVENKTRERIIFDENYRLDDIFAIEYSNNWWYVSIYAINNIDGSISWTLLKYNSVEDRYVYDDLNNINLTIR